jgi:hypothetical protein
MGKTMHDDPTEVFINGFLKSAAGRLQEVGKRLLILPASCLNWRLQPNALIDLFQIDLSFQQVAV